MITEHTAGVLSTAITFKRFFLALKGYQNLLYIQEHHLVTQQKMKKHRRFRMPYQQGATFHKYTVVTYLRRYP